jgi:radical SAM family uncharacterized protein/radical SAM-linked protein
MQSLQSRIDSILLDVEKPGRYCGGEFNSIVKKDPLFRTAISYPDLYEIGMANHGLRILYEVANAVEGCACERVFSVADDMRDILIAQKIPLFTLESRTPLSECGLVSFNASHELIYTNILQILDLGQIPLHRADRTQNDPFVCAGGDAASNPAPLSLFIDFFCLGEGEESYPELIRVLMEEKAKQSTRAATLERVSQIEGVVVSDYLEDYGTKRTARKRRYTGPPVNPLKPIVPSMRISQDKAVVEVTRGCANLCSFCHAGYYSLPSRTFSSESSVDAAKAILANTGYDDVTFLSLSIGDYREITELLNNGLPYFNERGVSISLPSLKVDEGTLPIIRTISDIRRTSITLAIEAADEETRVRINKKLTIEELEKIVTTLFAGGWDTLKFYFMIGLPGFRDHDEAKAILDLLMRIDYLGFKKKKINVTVSPFIPKPHTPFEGEQMADEAYFRETVRTIKGTVPRRISIKNHNIGSSLIEGLLARGGTETGLLIEDAYRRGAHLDSWDEFFRYDIWKESLKAVLPDTSAMFKERELSTMPWKFIDTGYGRLTEKMKTNCSHKIYNPSLVKPLDTEASLAALERFKVKYECRSRARIILTKTGTMRFISHLDYMEIVKRGLRILGMPVSYTQGFNKHERIAAGFPLPLGIESEHEIFDMDLYGEYDAAEIFAKGPAAFPAGVRIVSLSQIDTKDSLMAAINALTYCVEADEQAIAAIRTSLEEKIPLVKHGKEGSKKDIAFETAILSHSFTDGKISIVVSIGTPDSLRIDQIIPQLAGTAKIPFGMQVLKTGTWTTVDGKLSAIV